MFYVQVAARFGKPVSVKNSDSFPVASLGRRRPQCGPPLGSTAATLYCGMRRKRCAGCGVNWADPPSSLCPGCQAYAEHQA
jgi:hypothetical protein